MGHVSPNEVSEEERQRVARAIEHRVAELGIDWQDIPERGGPSASKVREFVNGRSHTFTRSKRRQLERALEWIVGSFDETAAGGEPKTVQSVDPSRRFRVRRGDGPWVERVASDRTPAEVEERRAATRRNVAQFGDTVIKILQSVIDDADYPVTPAERDELRGMVDVIRKTGEEFGPVFHVPAVSRTYMDEIQAILRDARKIIGGPDVGELDGGADGKSEDHDVIRRARWDHSALSAELASGKQGARVAYGSLLAAVSRFGQQILAEIELRAASKPDQAVVPQELFDAYKTALEAVLRPMKTLQDTVERQGDLTSEMVHALLEAIDTYVNSASETIREMLANSALATKPQVSNAVDVVEKGQAFSQNLSSFIGLLIPMAPNDDEVTGVQTRQQSLRHLAELNRTAYNSFVDLGRSSGGLKRAHQEPSTELVKATSAGIKQSDDQQYVEKMATLPQKLQGFPGAVRQVVEDLAEAIPEVDFRSEWQKIDQMYGAQASLPYRVVHMEALGGLLERVADAVEEHATEIEVAKGFQAIIKHLRERAEPVESGYGLAARRVGDEEKPE